MTRSKVPVLGLCGLLACTPTEGEAPGRAPAPPVTAVAPAEPVPEPAATEAPPPPGPLEALPMTVPGAGHFDHDALLEVLREARPIQFKPVGTSSVVFRMQMEGDHTAAFRPRTRRHRHGADAEIGAYGIGRLLGLDNVLPTVRRTIPRRRIRERLHPRYDDAQTWEDLEDEIQWSGGYEVPGAAIYWVPEMEDPELDTPAARARWGEWLTVGASIPSESTTIARDLSNMVVFDYVIGNWDRFSGGNLKVFPANDEESARVVLRDHNAALAPVLPDGIEERLWAEVYGVQRFSRDLADRLSRLDAAAVERALEEDGAPMLTQGSIDGAVERAARVTSYIGALVDQHGPDEVLFFP